MENLEQQPVNLQSAPIQNDNQNPPSTNSEFAQKQPLIEPKTLNLIKKLGITCFSVVMIFVVGIVAYNMMPKPTPIATVNTGNDQTTDEQNDKEDLRYFGYIKDEKAIWIADTNGENKKVIVEIPTSSKAIISTITWKSPKEITYSVCAGPASDSCEVKTVNIDDKSTVNEFIEQGMVRKITWDKTSQYVAFIEEGPAKGSSSTGELRSTSFRLKTGTIFTDLETFTKQEDPTNINSRVLFSDDNQYIVYYGIEKLIKKPVGGGSETTVLTPKIQIYLLNGTKVDEITGGRDPFFITENKLGYIKDLKIVYKTIGLKDETIATAFNGYTPQISPDKNLIAYWYAEGSLSNVVLGVFDTTLNIHRNILRGIVLPYWISDSQIIGIKADNCLGSSCQLYEFKTNSISLVDITRGNVVQIDQGRKISEPSYVFFDEQDAN